MSHEIKILHSNEFGYIGTCENCGHIHLELGSFMAVVNQKSFYAIAEDFSKKEEVMPYVLVLTPNGKKKLIAQITKHTYLSLSTSEFRQCLELLDMSKHLLEAYNIIRS